MNFKVESVLKNTLSRVGENAMWLRLWTLFRLLREDIVLLFFAWRNPRVPRYIKTLLFVAVGYLISPVDFIPDYLPAIGMVDDMVIVPTALFYLTRLLPVDIRLECERDAKRLKRKMPYILSVLAIVVLVWIAFLIWGIYTLLK